MLVGEMKREILREMIVIRHGKARERERER